MKVGKRNQLLILVVITFSFSGAFGADCGCSCKWLSRSGKNTAVCKYLEDLNIVVETNKEALINWNKYISFVERFSENWRQDIASIVEEQVEKEGNRNPRVDLKTEGTTAVPAENPKIIDLQTRLIAVEKQTQELEKELAEERKIRKQLERDVAGTRATLIDLTEQIMNLTTSIEFANNVLPTFLNQNLDVFVEYLKKDLQKLRTVRSATELGIGNWTLPENPGLFEEYTEIPNAALRLGSLEKDVKTLNSSIGGILTTIYCVDCEKWKKKRTKSKEHKKKYRKMKDQTESKPIWDDY